MASNDEKASFLEHKKEQQNGPRQVDSRPSISPWGSTGASLPQKSLQSIIDEEQIMVEKKKQDDKAATHVDEEEEMLRQALELSKRELCAEDEMVELAIQKSMKQVVPDPVNDFRRRVQEESEMTETFVESPHRQTKRVLIRSGMSSLRSLGSTRSQTSLRSLGSAKSYSSHERENGEDRKLPALANPVKMHHERLDEPPNAEATLSPKDKAAIEQALRDLEVNDEHENEARSIQLALQMIDEDKYQSEQTTAAARRRLQPQGKVRTITRAEYEREQRIGVGAFSANFPAQRQHPLEREMAATSGFRMNANSTQDWVRRDQNSVIGPNDEVRTKHDPELDAKANVERLGLENDEVEGTLIGNKAYNSFMQSVRKNDPK